MTLQITSMIMAYGALGAGLAFTAPVAGEDTSTSRNGNQEKQRDNMINVP